MPPALVVLAAGRGTRFGGPKQLAEVRDDGATITDVLIERAAAAGIGRVVVVVSDATEHAMSAHLATRHSDAVVVRQGGTRGTAQALLAARDVTDGPVLVVNADDIYPPDAFVVARRHIDAGEPSGHAVIGFVLRDTLYGSRSQSRAVLQVDGDRLVRIREGSVTQDGALAFTPKDEPGSAQPFESGVAEPLVGTELVSMNAMVLQRDIFDRLAEALATSDAEEVYLPDVIATLVASGEVITVLPCTGRCHGLTYPEDADTVTTLL